MGECWLLLFSPLPFLLLGTGFQLCLCLAYMDHERFGEKERKRVHLSSQEWKTSWGWGVGARKRRQSSSPWGPYLPLQRQAVQ